MLSYLESLTVRLALAAAELPEATRQRHGDFMLAAQREDGGFAGREGGSDLYYTGFWRFSDYLTETYRPKLRVSCGSVSPDRNRLSISFL